MVGDLSGGPDTLARIVRVEPRRTVLRRSADDSDPYERVIVANADQLVVVTSLADPPPRVGLIDRCLVAAYVGGLDPLLCLTKADLASPDELLAAYADLGMPAVATRRGGDLGAAAGPAAGPHQRARRPLRGRQVDSGERAGPGRATGPSARSARSAGAGTPRPRRSRCRCRRAAGSSTPRGSARSGWPTSPPPTCCAAFPDLAEGAEECPVNCTHRSAADGCRLDEYVAEGHSTPGRLASFRRLLEAKD